MKVGGAGSQPTQNRALGLADIGALPVIKARAGSVVCVLVPSLHWMEYTGRSLTFRAGNAGKSVMPMLMASGSEWLPTFGESWHVVQNPFTVDRPGRSLRPATPVMVIGKVLNKTSPWAMDARCGSG